jgi:serine/threonine protein phosphatase 1
LGNHEEMMLNFLDGCWQPDDWLECGGRATLASYGLGVNQKEVPSNHLDFIRTWIDWYQIDTHFFVHASYEPDLPLEDQNSRTLRWPSLRDWVPAPHVSGKIAVVGHTSLKDGEVLDVGHLICIDTYCWGGGWLTALDATSGQIWQVDRDGRIRE